MQISGQQNSVARGAIASVALEEFYRVGYHGTGMRQIARLADRTLSSIYHHYGSKQEILQYVMVRTLDDALTLTGAHLKAAGPDPVSRLTAVVQAWICFHTSRQPEAFVGLVELRSLDAEGLAMVMPKREEQASLFLEVVTEGVSQGVFGTAYPAEASKAIVSIGAAISTWYRHDEHLDQVEMARRYCRLALGFVEPTSVAAQTFDTPV